MAVVTVILDIDVEEGDPEKVKDALFKDRKKISDYVINVVAANNEDSSPAKIAKLGANTHVHEKDGGYCRKCVNHAEKDMLINLQD